MWYGGVIGLQNVNSLLDIHNQRGIMRFNYRIFGSAMRYVYKNLFISENSSRKRGYKKTNLTKNDIIIGEYTYGLPIIYNFNEKYKVRIGKFCCIAENVKILVDGNHITDWVTIFPFEFYAEGFPGSIDRSTGTERDIIIGNDVWIGMDALILPRVRIGDGAMIGAGSVVTKDVEDYEIVGGAPARHIRYRFSKEQIENLKTIKWWDWPLEKIRQNSPLLESSEIDKFIDMHNGPKD
jgi:acetyltransferase-like isoleucine patch superfamily enzyme